MTAPAAPPVSPTIVQVSSPAPPLTMPLRVRGQTPIPAGNVPRPRSPPAPIVLPQAPPPAPFVFELPTVAPAPSASPTIMRVASHPRTRNCGTKTPPLSGTGTCTNSPAALARVRKLSRSNSSCPRTPNLMIRVRGTPIPDHELVSEHEPVPNNPPHLSWCHRVERSVSDISVDQPRPSTPAPERQSIPQQTPPVEAEDRHERPPSAAAPIPSHPTVIQVPVPPPSRTAFIRMVTPVIPQSKPPEVTTVAQPPISVEAASIEAVPIEPEPLAVPREPSPPPPTILTVPAPFVAPTSQVRVKGRAQELAPAQTLPLTATEPPIEPTEPAEPTPVAVVPEPDAFPALSLRL
jgi:hypothetical protein